MAVRYVSRQHGSSVRSILHAPGWQQSASVLEILGDFDEEERAAAYDLGGTIAALSSE